MNSCCCKTAFKNAEPQVDCVECCEESYDFDWGTECSCTSCPVEEKVESLNDEVSEVKMEPTKKTYTIIDI